MVRQLFSSSPMYCQEHLKVVALGCVQFVGGYQIDFLLVILKDDKWCWKVSEISTVVVRGSQDPLKFSHIGYSMSYEVSHDTLIVSSVGMIILGPVKTHIKYSTIKVLYCWLSTATAMLHCFLQEAMKLYAYMVNQ